MAVIAVLTNLPDSESAFNLARILVARRVAACVNVLAPATSFYRWEGREESATEVPLVIKTTEERYAELESIVRECHPYDLPEIIAFPVRTASRTIWGGGWTNASPIPIPAPPDETPPCVPRRLRGRRRPGRARARRRAPRSGQGLRSHRAPGGGRHGRHARQRPPRHRHRVPDRARLLPLRSRLKFELHPATVLIGPPELPPGIVVDDPFLGKSAIFRDRVVIHLPFAVSVAKPGMYRVKIVAQGCAEERICNSPFPQEVAVNIPPGYRGMDLPATPPPLPPRGIPR